LSQDEVHFAEGDYVVIKNLDREGIIIEKNEKKKQCQIQIDHLKLTIPFRDIQKINKPGSMEVKIEPATCLSHYPSHKDRLEKKAKFRHEISIRQMNVGDAQIRLEKYLDDAFLLNVSPVYIVHGKGKGILRQQVARLLDQLSYVKSYRYGEVYEGGDGVTVVYF